jgi:hypothetical protein
MNISKYDGYDVHLFIMLAVWYHGTAYVSLQGVPISCGFSYLLPAQRKPLANQAENNWQ